MILTATRFIVFKDLRDGKHYGFYVYRHGSEYTEWTHEVWDPAFEVAKITKTVEVWESVEDLKKTGGD